MPHPPDTRITFALAHRQAQLLLHMLASNSQYLCFRVRKVSRTCYILDISSVGRQNHLCTQRVVVLCLLSWLQQSGRPLWSSWAAFSGAPPGTKMVPDKPQVPRLQGQRVYVRVCWLFSSDGQLGRWKELADTSGRGPTVYRAPQSSHVHSPVTRHLYSWVLGAPKVLGREHLVVSRVFSPF